ncbi:MAG: M16 family metallopeptidase [Acidobacteriota bacterium]
MTLTVAIFTGSSSDPAGKQGLAFLTAQLLRPPSTILPDDAHWQATVGRDLTLLRLSLPAGEFTDRYPSIVESILRPTVDEDRVERQRASQGRAMRSLLDRPRALVAQAFDGLAFQNHPYAHPVEGTIESLETLTSADVLGFHAELCRKGNVIVGLEGPYDPALLEKIRAAFDPLPEGTPDRLAAGVSYLTRPRVLVARSDAAAETWVMMGHPITTAPAHPDHFEMEAIRTHLALIAGGDQGRPGALPRNQSELTVAFHDAGAGAAERIAILLESWKSLASKGLPEARVESIRRRLIAEHAAAQEDPGALIRASIEQLFNRTPGYDERYEASVRAITPERLAAVASRQVFPERIAIAVITPDTEGFIRGLRHKIPRFSREDFIVVPAAELLH